MGHHATVFSPPRLRCRSALILLLAGILLVGLGPSDPVPPEPTAAGPALTREGSTSAAGSPSWGRVLALDEASVATATARPRWLWPLAPVPRVATAFRPPAQKWLSGHRGVDLESSPGQEVRAPAAGTVTFSGTVVERGVVTVTTADGRRTSFEPVAEQLPRGTRVVAGERIAVRDPAAAHEGCPGCLHWGVREGEEYVNPLLFVQDLEPSVLLPVPDDLK